jgi:hypothetical protein
LHSKLWHQYSGRLAHPQLLIAKYEEKQQERAQENAILLEQAESLRADIYKGKAKIDRLVDLYSDGDVDRATYRKKKREIKDAVKDAVIELAALEAQMEAHALTDDRKTRLLEFCRAMVDRLDASPPLDEKRKVLLMLDVKVTHLPDQAELKVTGAFPDEYLSTTP